MPQISRRLALAAPLTVALAARLHAAETIGTTLELTGSGRLIRDGRQQPLAIGMGLAEGDTIRIGQKALALLMLNTDTRINMGPETELVLARYLADAGGSITLGGAIVFDRPEGRPPLDLTIQTEFGAIGVRGTRFFFGPSKGRISVFVDRGTVAVTNAGVTRSLHGGDGVDLAAGQPPGDVARWKAARIASAFALVGLAP